MKQFSRRHPRLTGWLKFTTVVVVAAAGVETAATLDGGWPW